MFSWWSAGLVFAVVAVGVDVYRDTVGVPKILTCSKTWCVFLQIFSYVDTVRVSKFLVGLETRSVL